MHTLSPVIEMIIQMPKETVKQIKFLKSKYLKIQNNIYGFIVDLKLDQKVKKTFILKVKIILLERKEKQTLKT